MDILDKDIKQIEAHPILYISWAIIPKLKFPNFFL